MAILHQGVTFGATPFCGTFRIQTLVPAGLAVSARGGQGRKAPVETQTRRRMVT